MRLLLGFAFFFFLPSQREKQLSKWLFRLCSLAEPRVPAKSKTAVLKETRGCIPERLGGAAKQQSLSYSRLKRLHHDGPELRRRWRGAANNRGSSLLGLLAKIKCSICSYQLNLWYEDELFSR